MRKHPPRPRRGIALIFAIVCLAVLVIVFGVLVKLASAEKRQSRAEERRARAAWLAESGLERAWAKLSASRDYAGETWEIPAETLGGRDAAIVLIVVEPVPGEPGHRVVRSRADFPREEPSRARQTRISEMKLNATVQGENR